MKYVLTILGALALMGGNCAKTPPYLSTQLDHVSAATMVTCDAYPTPAGASPLSQRTCLVIANPLRPLMRIYDVSQVQFLLSPIGYSPLGVRVNGLTTQLASYSTADQGTVFVYDASLSRVTAISARNGSAAPSFSGVPHPMQNLDQRPLKMLVSNPNGPSIPLLFALNRDGSVESFTYDDAAQQFSSLQQISAPLGFEVTDALYDVNTGIYAALYTQGGVNKIYLKQLTGATGTPATNTIDNVGNVRMALGQLNTSTASQPHLFLMQRGAAKLTTIRLNAATLQQDGLNNPITLKDTLTGIYVPSGAKQTCCGTTSEWIAASSDDGMVYYLTAGDLQSTVADRVFQATMNLSKLLPSGTLSGLSQIVGGDVNLLQGAEAPQGRSVCARQVFYLFSPGYVVATCEGSATGASLIVSRDLAENP